MGHRVQLHENALPRLGHGRLVRCAELYLVFLKEREVRQQEWCLRFHQKLNSTQFYVSIVLAMFRQRCKCCWMS